MTKYKSILRKRPRIPRESKRGLFKKKVFFKEEKNEEKTYHLTELEQYEKIITWHKILRNAEDY